MNRDIKILMHTHWDREWYFTKDETKVLLRNHMQEVLAFLASNEDVTYILDGQSVMIDDYLELEPEAEPLLRKFIQNKQLRVGPWYTQTDLLLVHGESIYRNLYYGIKRAKEFGDPMLIGYAPDTFGHASQMPQIYAQFNIGGTVFWRGFSELKAEKSDFMWKGIDGTEVVGVNLATGYQGAKYLESDLTALQTRMEKIMTVLDKYAASNQRLIMNGHDQMPIQKDIKKVIKHLKEIYPEDQISISDFESYIKGLEPSELERVEGELTHSKHARIHRTIGSTRMDIKLLNSEIEYKVFHILEPLAVIGYQAGIAYPHTVIENILKYLFGTHAHDSIGGCNSDKVNQDIKQRLLIAKEMVDTQIELHLRLLTMAYSDAAYPIIILNLLPEERKNTYVTYDMLTRSPHFKIFNEDGNEVAYTIAEQHSEDAGLIDRQVAARLQDITVYRTQVVIEVDAIAGLSSRYFTFEEYDSPEQHVPQPLEETKITNQWVEINIANNQITFTDKTTGERYHNILSIENSGDAGDSYDYSPPINDWIINSSKHGELTAHSLKNDNFEELQFKLTMAVPSDSEQREQKSANETVTFEGTLRLYKKDPKVHVTLTHTNQSEDSRYRVVFNPQIKNEHVTVDGYLCVQEKPIYLEKELRVWEEENWVEKPISIETMQSFIQLKDETKEFTVVTKGLKEYEVVGEELAITLFRSFSHLGKRNLVNRPGRPSGIEIPTPDNQLQGVAFEWEFAFGFEHLEVNAAKAARNYLTPLLGYQLKEFNRFNLNARDGVLPSKDKLSLDLGEAVLSACKLTEENDVFIRLFNPSDQDLSLDLPQKTYQSNGMEVLEKEINTLVLKPQEIGNLIIKK